MSHNLVTALVLAAVVGFALAAPPPPSACPGASRSTTSDNAIGTPKAASTTLLAHQAPIPLVRNLPAALAPTVVPERATSASEQRPREDAERKATAKAAIEADGYKRVTVLGRTADGTWQAKAYRGTTEVLLAVDEAGRVSMQ